MSSRLLLVAALAVAGGCRGGGGSKPADNCEVVEASVKPAGDAIEVALSVRWTVAGKNNRTNKPIELGRFAADKHTVTELQARYKVGAKVECSIDPTRPTRVALHSSDH